LETWEKLKIRVITSEVKGTLNKEGITPGNNKICANEQTGK